MRPSGVFRRRLNTACRTCRERKVRCDAIDGEACTSCKRAGTECRSVYHSVYVYISIHISRIGKNLLLICRTARPHPNELRHSPAQRRTIPPNEGVGPSVPASLLSRATENSRASPSPIPITPEVQGEEILSSFFERGVVSSDWDGFERNGSFRIVYVGTEIANLNHLVRNSENPRTSCLHYPFPSMRDPLPWKPQPGLSTSSYMTEAIIRDVSSFPAQEVRDSLVETYFKDIHPGFPIIDEADFRRQYADPVHHPPLLVFQAVLLAAARISDHPMVSASRAMVTATLFRRAKTLFDIRYENDRLHLVQAAFLLAFHTENSDTVSSNAYHWIGTAVRMAFGMGMHRMAASRYLPPAEYRSYRIYKKVWWSLVHAEVFSALELGRPCMIREEDFDVSKLEDDDFQNMNDSADGLVNRLYCSVMADLCLVGLDVLNLYSPRRKDQANIKPTIHQRLAEVALKIPSSRDFWSCQLQANYNLVVLICHRNDNDTDAVSLCSEAASNILITFETMLVQGTIRQCYLTSSVALAAVATQLFQDVKLALTKGSIMKAVSACSQLERLSNPLNALLKYWPPMKSLLRLCQSLSSHAEDLVRQYQEQGTILPPDIQFPVLANIDWQHVIDNQILTTDLTSEVEGWMDVSSWGNSIEN